MPSDSGLMSPLIAVLHQARNPNLVSWPCNIVWFLYFLLMLCTWQNLTQKEFFLKFCHSLSPTMGTLPDGGKVGVHDHILPKWQLRLDTPPALNILYYISSYSNKLSLVVSIFLNWQDQHRLPNDSKMVFRGGRHQKKKYISETIFFRSHLYHDKGIHLNKMWAPFELKRIE